MLNIIECEARLVWKRALSEHYLNNDVGVVGNALQETRMRIVRIVLSLNIAKTNIIKTATSINL